MRARLVRMALIAAAFLVSVSDPRPAHAGMKAESAFALIARNGDSPGDMILFRLDAAREHVPGYVLYRAGLGTASGFVPDGKGGLSVLAESALEIPATAGLSGLFGAVPGVGQGTDGAWLVPIGGARLAGTSGGFPGPGTVPAIACDTVAIGVLGDFSAFDLVRPPGAALPLRNGDLPVRCARAVLPGLVVRILFR